MNSDSASRSPSRAARASSVTSSTRTPNLPSGACTATGTRSARGTTGCPCDCSSFRDAISARLDGEDAGLPDEGIDAHLAALRRLPAGRRPRGRSPAWSAGRRAPTCRLDPALLAALVAPARRAPAAGLFTTREWRIMLGVIAAALFVVVWPGRLPARGPRLGPHRPPAHRLGHGPGRRASCVAALFPARAWGMLPLACVLVACMVGASALDALSGHALLGTELVHALEVAGLGCLWVVARRSRIACRRRCAWHEPAPRRPSGPGRRAPAPPPARSSPRWPWCCAPARADAHAELLSTEPGPAPSSTPRPARSSSTSARRSTSATTSSGPRRVRRRGRDRHARAPRGERSSVALALPAPGRRRLRRGLAGHLVRRPPGGRGVHVPGRRRRGRRPADDQALIDDVLGGSGQGDDRALGALRRRPLRRLRRHRPCWSAAWPSSPGCGRRAGTTAGPAASLAVGLVGLGRGHRAVHPPAGRLRHRRHARRRPRPGRGRRRAGRADRAGVAGPPGAARRRWPCWRGPEADRWARVRAGPGPAGHHQPHRARGVRRPGAAGLRGRRHPPRRGQRVARRAHPAGRRGPAAEPAAPTAPDGSAGSCAAFSRWPSRAVVAIVATGAIQGWRQLGGSTPCSTPPTAGCWSSRSLLFGGMLVARPRSAGRGSRHGPTARGPALALSPGPGRGRRVARPGPARLAVLRRSVARRGGAGRRRPGRDRRCSSTRCPAAVVARRPGRRAVRHRDPRRDLDGADPRRARRGRRSPTCASPSPTTASTR